MAEDENALAGRLIERLLVDPVFRGEFRRDPASACVAAGLPELAQELGGGVGSGMQTLELRESRSSLAGVVMAAAVEGLSVAEAQAFVEHGAKGLKVGHGLKLPHGVRAPSAVGKVQGLEHRAVGRVHHVEHQVKAAGHAAGRSPSAAAGAPGAPGGQASSAASSNSPASSGSSASASAGQAPAGQAAAGQAGGVAASHAAGGGPAAVAATQGGGGGQTPAGGVSHGGGGGGSPAASAALAAGASGPPAAAGASGAGASLPWPDAPGAGGGAAAGGAAAGGAGGVAVGGGGAAAGVVGSVPAGTGGVGAAASSVVGGGGVAGAGGVVGAGSVGPTGLSGLLEAPGLQASPQVRAFLASGGADPRVVSMLDSVLAHHTVGVADVVATSSPVHVQAIDIVSVDGQPVGPQNFAARDLVTEIAAMDPSVRPDEIGTPWPIQSPGFFSDQTSQGSLHLAFEMPGANAGAPAGGVVPAAASGSLVPGAVPGVQAVPGAVPGAQAVPGAVPGAQAVPGAGVPGAAPSVAGAPAPGGVAAATPAAPGVAAATPGAPVGDVAAQASPAGGVAQPSVAGGGYVNPLPSDANIGRTDMGVDVDLKPGEPIVAIGNSRVLGIMPNWYQGQPYVALQLLDGPMKGHNYYIAEQITPAVQVGQVIHAGEPIAHYAASGTGIEMGWAGSNWQQTLAQAEGNTGDPSHNNAPAGVSFSNFLHSLTNRASGGASSTPAVAATAEGASAASGTAPAGGAAPAVAGAQAAGGTPAVAGNAAGAPATAGAGAPVTPAAAAPAPGVAAAGAAPVPAAGTPDPNAAVPGVSGTAQFPAVGGHEPHPKYHTVKFMQAVPPPAASPLAQTAGTGAPAGIDPTTGQPVAGQPVADQIQGQPGTAAPGSTAPGLGEQALSQAPAPAGSIVSVSSSMLTKGQETFVAHLASATGLDTRVVAGWVLAEESGSAAQGREAASNFNWLNIGYFDSGTGAIAHASPFSDPVSAAEQTAKFLKGQWGGASTGIQDILKTVGKPPGDQIMAIANSGWASSHYNNGANLRATFDELSDMKIVTAAPAGAGLAVPPPGTSIT